LKLSPDQLGELLRRWESDRSQILVTCWWTAALRLTLRGRIRKSTSEGFVITDLSENCFSVSVEFIFDNAYVDGEDRESLELRFPNGVALVLLRD
jgi:hypothetical protein